MQDFNPCGKLSGFLIELAEAGDLPSQPPVVKVANVALEVHEVAGWPDKEGAEPSGEGFNGIFFAMPNRVSLCIQIDNIRGLIRALVHMESGDASIFQLFDPFCWFEDSVAQRDVEVGHLPLVVDVAIWGSFEDVFVMFDSVVEPGDLFLETADFNIFVGVTSGNGCEEPLCDGPKDVGVEVRVCRQRGRNGIRRHRWFRSFKWVDRERDAVLDGRGVGRIGRAV
jgi:hypothetical protein